MSLSAEAPWLNFYGDMPRSIDYPRTTLYEQIALTARQYPNDTAYEFFGQRTSYAQLLARIDRAALALHSLGIGSGDRVTICMPNTPQAVDCFYALSRLGAVSNMIHPLSAPQEITFYLDVSHSKAILTLDRFFGKVCSAASEAKESPLLLIARIEDELSLPLRCGFALTQAKKYPKLPRGGYLLWRDVLRSAVGALPPSGTDCEVCASILYSGGTTGKTKGICLSSRNFNALALQTIAASGVKSLHGFSMLSVMPIFHGFGLGIGIHTALVGGAKCILVPNFSIKVYPTCCGRKSRTLFPAFRRCSRRCCVRTDRTSLICPFSSVSSPAATVSRRS